MKTKIALCCLLFLLFLGSAFAQNNFNCATDKFYNKLTSQYPEIKKKEQQMEKSTDDYIRNKKITNTKSNQTYVIPVVFHVLHQYGVENISDAQIMDAIRIINEDFSKSNADTASVIPDFDSIIGNANIEFRLAQLDPFGNCTNGIDRIYTHKTNQADDYSKINIWNRSNYLNIWVVKSIGESGVAGYAYYPSAVDAPMLAGIDGIVILHNYVGSIGTSNQNNSRALTHEIGHYFNLQHPWGNNNDPGVACGDDGVHDTPETKGFVNCPSNPNNAAICNSTIIENYQNFMDYSYCSKMFTKGQSDRIGAALNSSISNRNNLWKYANLVQTGTDIPNPTSICTPVADFSSNRRLVCQGDNVVFTDATWKASTDSLYWEFPNATPLNSSNSTVSVNYSNLYWNNVSLTAFNNVGSNTVTKQGQVYVSPPWADYSVPFSYGFENTNNNQMWFSITNDYNASKWQISNTSGVSGTMCMYLNAYSEPVYSPTYTPEIGRNDVDGLISPAFDLSNVSSGILEFKFTAATRASNISEITEEFKIYASIDCGKTWLPLKIIQGVNLANAGSWSNPYFPSQNTNWENVSINLPTILQNDNVRFKFEYTSGSLSNNLFLDDINISGVVGISETDNDNGKLIITPNPINEIATISYEVESSQSIIIEVYDLIGNKVKELFVGSQSGGYHSLKYNFSELKSGLYIVSIKGKTIMLNQKIIIK